MGDYRLKDEFDYFKKRESKGPDTIFVAKVVGFDNFDGYHEQRTIRKVFDKEELSEFERVKGDIILRVSEGKGRDQVKVIVYENDTKKMRFTLQRFRADTGTPYKYTGFTFSDREFAELCTFLHDLKFIDLSNRENFQVKQSNLHKERIVVDISEKKLIDAFKNIKGEGREQLLESLKKNNLTKQDLDILSGRREGLELFRNNLFNQSSWKEPDWQKFFDKNTWIFGYGLDYKFLQILQKEAHVSDADLDGKNDTISDFLLGSDKFTVIVELKKPDTKLFEKDQNRANSWKLSKDLIYGVSQILAQKAAWQIKCEHVNYKDDGEQITQHTFDPKAILIIGSSKSFKGTDRESVIKAKTFELFRRDSRNIEILTYDELYERAYFIVNQQLPNE